MVGWDSLCARGLGGLTRTGDWEGRGRGRRRRVAGGVIC